LESVRLTALSGNDFEVGEISAHGAAAPEADQPFLAVAQLSDDHTELIRVIDEDTDFRTLDYDAHMKPIVGVWGGVDSLLVFAWMFVAQLLRGISWTDKFSDGLLTRTLSNLAYYA
jgi:hypothetical protein